MKPLSDDHRTRVTRMLIRRAFTEDVYKRQLVN